MAGSGQSTDCLAKCMKNATIKAPISNSGLCEFEMTSSRVVRAKKHQEILLFYFAALEMRQNYSSTILRLQ